MAKKILGLGADGKLVLRLPGGKTEPLPEPVHAQAFLLIDCSSSMSGSKLTQAIGGALGFAGDAIKKNYAVGLIRFASAAEILSYPEGSLSNLASRAEHLTANGSTNMSDGIEKAATELNKVAGVRAMVIVTDGAPDSPGAALAAASRAKESGIDIIAIGTDDADRAFLEKIASRSDLAMKVHSAQLQSGITDAARMLPSPTRTK
jgi:Ca-activated chloride channel homolog